MSSSDPSLLFKGIRFNVSSKNHHQFVDHPGAVVILPLLADGEIVMIQNERPAVGESLWELPAGTLEPGEKPIETAYRELAEETGYQAKAMDPLLNYYTTPGFCNEKIHAFLATDLTFIGQNLDPTEKITTTRFRMEALLEMIREGVIHDGKTIATLLYYHLFRSV